MLETLNLNHEGMICKSFHTYKWSLTISYKNVHRSTFYLKFSTSCNDLEIKGSPKLSFHYNPNDIPMLVWMSWKQEKCITDLN